jgi:hypothetical protein
MVRAIKQGKGVVFNGLFPVATFEDPIWGSESIVTRDSNDRETKLCKRGLEATNRVTVLCCNLCKEIIETGLIDWMLELVLADKTEGKLECIATHQQMC